MIALLFPIKGFDPDFLPLAPVHSRKLSGLSQWLGNTPFFAATLAQPGFAAANAPPASAAADRSFRFSVAQASAGRRHMEKSPVRSCRACDPTASAYRRRANLPLATVAANRYTAIRNRHNHMQNQEDANF
jgi:hypothetical protein